MKKLLLPASLTLAIFVLLRVGPPGRPGSAENFVTEKDLAVPMRDGVLLRADVWRPRNGGPFPVLVYRTPYDRRRAPESYTTFRRAVERGYAVVIQDVRGRYASEGEFQPYQQEGRDGYDTIEWAAKQSWSNGTVGTFGLSYPGAVQWLAAVERPPHLKAMAPAMTFSTPRNFFYSGGVFDLSWIRWIWNNIAPDTRVKKNLPGPRTYEEARAEWSRIGERLLSYLPLRELPELKSVAPYYYEWMQHPPEDRWWDWCELRDKYARVDAAVLNLSGWYDEAYGPEGAITNFQGLVAARKGQRDLRAKLLIGPWTHGVDETGQTRAGEREFSDAARIDYDEVVLRWMDRYVKGLDNGVDREKPVQFFVMGQNGWRHEQSWPPPGTRRVSLYLAPSQGNKQAGALRWNNPPNAKTFREFVSDPAHPVTDPHPPYSGAHDYRKLASRSDVLVYDSAPLETDVEASGPITAEIYLSCDAPDTDLWVRLLEVTPDGTAFNLMSPGLDVIRASYSNPSRRGKLRPGRAYKLQLSSLVTSNLFRKGNRIRVQISTTFFPHFSRNLHTGQLETSSANMHKASVRIHTGQRYPSRVVLTLADRSANGE